MPLSEDTIRAVVQESLPPERKNESKGTFSGSTDHEPKDENDPTNPINIWIATPEHRSIVVSSNTIAGFLLFNEDNREAVVFSNPKTVLDEENNPITIGHCGNKIHHAFPMAVKPKALQGNVLSFLPSTLLNKQGIQIDQTPAENRTLTEKDDQGNDLPPMKLPSIITYPEAETKAHQAILPVAIPLPFGHQLEGPYDIQNDTEVFTALRAALAAIHSFYGHWLDGMSFMYNNSYRGCGLNSDQLNFPPELLFESPNDFWATAGTVDVSIRWLANTSNLAIQVIRELDDIAKHNFAKWWSENKTDFPTIIAQIESLQQPIGQGPGLGRTTPAPTTTSITDTAATNRRNRSMNQWKLFLSTKTSNDAVGGTALEFPELSADMISLLNESKPADGLMPLRRSIKEFQENRQLSTDFLNKASNFPVSTINVTFASVTRDCNFRTESMDDTTAPLNSSLHVYNFCPANVMAASYQAVVDQGHQILHEVANHEPDASRTKSTTGLYINGCQSTYDDLITTIANLHLYLSWLYQQDDNATEASIPDVLKDIRDVFTLVTMSKFKDWFNKWAPNMPFLAHSILDQVQQLLSARADFALKTSNVEKVANDVTVDDSGLAVYTSILANVKSSLTNVQFQATLQHFNVEPFSYQRFFPASQKKAKKSLQRQPFPESDTADSRL